MLALLLTNALAAPCDALDRLARHPGPLHPPPRLGAPPPGLGERDLYGAPNAARSARFILRWGDDADLSVQHTEALLEAFEASWAVAVDEMGHPPPEGTDQYRFNVYVGNTGQGSPDIGDGAAGYFTVDAEGWPIIVLQPYVLLDIAYGRTVAAHELYHAVQHATGRYALSAVGEPSSSANSRWFWEATATWFMDEVYPDDPYYAQFLAGFAYFPHYRLSFFADDESWLHQQYPYGAFVFPRYLSEQVADWTLIRDAWTDADRPPEALDAVASLLADRGLAMGDVVAAMGARNVRWDYADGDLYEAAVGGSYGGSDDHRISAWIPEDGTDGWQDPPEDTLPYRYGRNVLQVEYPRCGAWTLAVEGEETAAWHAQALVVSALGELRYEPVLAGDPAGELTLDLTGEEQALYLVVSPAIAASSAETFSYRYAMTLDPGEDCPDPDPPDLAKSAGDVSSRGCGGAAAGLLLVALPARRRRR